MPQYCFTAPVSIRRRIDKSKGRGKSRSSHILDAVKIGLSVIEKKKKK